MNAVRKAVTVVRNNYDKAGLAVVSALASSAALATPSALDTALDQFVTAMIGGVSTTMAKVGPLIALCFGIAYAFRWARKGSK